MLATGQLELARGARVIQVLSFWLLVHSPFCHVRAEISTSFPSEPEQQLERTCFQTSQGWWREDPGALAAAPDGDTRLLKVVATSATGVSLKLHEANYLLLRRATRARA